MMFRITRITGAVCFILVIMNIVNTEEIEPHCHPPLIPLWSDPPYVNYKYPGRNRNTFYDRTLEECKRECEQTIRGAASDYTCRSIEYLSEEDVQECVLQDTATTDVAELVQDNGYTYYAIICVHGGGGAAGGPVPSDPPHSSDFYPTFPVNPTRPTEVLTYGSIELMIATVSPGGLSMYSEETIMASIRTYLTVLDDGEMDRVAFVSADTNTGVIVFSIVERPADVITGCDAMGSMERSLNMMTSPLIEWSTGTYYGVKAFTYSARCFLVHGEQYWSSFSLTAVPNDFVFDYHKWSDLRDALISLLHLSHEDQRRLNVTEFRTEKDEFLFYIEHQSRFTRTSCTLSAELEKELSKSTTYIVFGADNSRSIHQMVAGSYVQPPQCLEEPNRILHLMIKYPDLSLTGAYEDPNSVGYKQLQNEVEQWVEDVARSGALRDYLLSVDLQSLTAGSVVANVNVMVSGAAPSDAAAILQQECDAAATADGGKIGNNKVSEITAREVTSAPLSSDDDDDKILGLKPLYLALIGFGIVALLLVIIAIVAMMMRTVSSEDKKHLDEEQPQHKNNRENTPPPEKKRRSLFGSRKNKKKDKHPEEDDDEKDGVHNDYTEPDSGENGGQLPY